jgi:hypothetical protein
VGGKEGRATMTRPNTVPQMQERIRATNRELMADLESLGREVEAMKAEANADGEKFTKIMELAKRASALPHNLLDLIEDIGRIAHAGSLGVEAEDVPSESFLTGGL